MFCRDAIIVSVLDSVTSVFAGLVIFSIIGYMAEVLEQPIKDVATEGIMVFSLAKKWICITQQTHNSNRCSKETLSIIKGWVWTSTGSIYIAWVRSCECVNYDKWVVGWKMIIEPSLDLMQDFFRFPFNRCRIGLCSIPWCSDKTPPFTIVVCAFLCYANHLGTWNSGKVFLPRQGRMIGKLCR